MEFAEKRELTKPAGRPNLHRPVIVGRRGTSAGHRLCEFQKIVASVGRRASSRCPHTSAGGIKYV